MNFKQSCYKQKKVKSVKFYICFKKFIKIARNYFESGVRK